MLPWLAMSGVHPNVESHLTVRISAYTLSLHLKERTFQQESYSWRWNDVWHIPTEKLPVCPDDGGISDPAWPNVVWLTLGSIPKIYLKFGYSSMKHLGIFLLACLVFAVNPSWATGLDFKTLGNSCNPRSTYMLCAKLLLLDQLCGRSRFAYIQTGGGTSIPWM